MKSLAYILAFAAVASLSSVPASAQPVEVIFEDLSNDSLVVVTNPSKGVSSVRIERLVRRYVNQLRRKHRLSALDHNEDLDPVARGHSADMYKRDFFSHVNPDGESPTDRGQRKGYECQLEFGDVTMSGIAENLLYTYIYRSVTTARFPDRIELTFDWKKESEIAREVVNAWFDSPSHRKNLMDEQSQTQSIGVFIGENGRIYVTQNFC